MSDVILSTEKLSVGYGSRCVVRDIDLRVCGGEVLCLIGPNGAGKSTLLKTLIRRIPPLSGGITLCGEALGHMTDRDLARTSAAVLTGRPEPELALCEEVVAMGRYPYTGRLGILSDADRRVIRTCMDMTETADLAAEDFSRISDGQRQRVLLARALCQEPKLLIMDEPTSFLDIRHKLEFLHLLRRLVAERNLAVVMSMHELDLAQRFVDRLACLRDGIIDRVDTPEALFRGDTIRSLFSVERGSFDPLFGTAEPERNDAPPRIFVIGGGGNGIPLYRRLARQGIPFAAGVLPENDLDAPVAAALASVVITDSENEPVSAASVDRALQVLRRCEAVYCTQENFGTVNRENRRLLDAAGELGLLRQLDGE